MVNPNQQRKRSSDVTADFTRVRGTDLAALNNPTEQSHNV